VSQAAYAQSESAKRPRKTTLLKMAQALGVTAEQLAW
jgi:transcriptional regulator with XRE-family HTH domain